jgi:hypothetical protein
MVSRAKKGLRHLNPNAHQGEFKTTQVYTAGQKRPQAHHTKNKRASQTKMNCLNDGVPALKN